MRTGEVFSLIKFIESLYCLRSWENEKLEQYPILNLMGLLSERNIPILESSASLNVKKSNLSNRTMTPVLWVARREIFC